MIVMLLLIKQLVVCGSTVLQLMYPDTVVSIDESAIVPVGWGMTSLLLLIGASDVALKP